MRPFLLGLLLFLHALAQSAVGVWAVGSTSAWIVTPLWLLAMGGFLMAAFAIWGIESLGKRAAPLAAIAAVASCALQWIAGISVLSIFGIALSILLAMLVRWWARCAHPEIHTPTMATSEYPAVYPDRPNNLQRLWSAVAWCALAYTALLIVARPWHQAWGASAIERAETIPGAPRDVATKYRVDHAITVQAPSTRVWPWIAQLGQDRAGFYSYDWLERAFGDEIANADSLVPAWQERHVGELVRATQPNFMRGRFGRDLGWRITHWNPPHAMVLDQWGQFSVRAIDDSTSRILVQTRGAGEYSWRTLLITPISFYVLEPAHFIMERRMLMGIKERAESVEHRVANRG